MSGAKLEIWKIGKRFQGIVAVDSISFAAPAGRVTGLIGPNGSGKTTTMNMITGLYPTDAGRITQGHGERFGGERRHGVGAAPSAAGQLPWVVRTSMLAELRRSRM